MEAKRAWSRVRVNLEQGCERPDEISQNLKNKTGACGGGVALLTRPVFPPPPVGRTPGDRPPPPLGPGSGSQRKAASSRQGIP